MRFTDPRDLRFNQYGNLLFTSARGFAVEFVQTSPFVLRYNDFLDHFSNTEARKCLVLGFEKMIMRLSQHGLRQANLVLGGGFISDQESPKDVDVIMFFDSLVSKRFRADRVFTEDAVLSNQSEVFANYGCNLFAVDVGAADGMLNVAKWITRFSFDKKSATIRGLIALGMADVISNRSNSET